jgi:hypothetical protein
MIKIIEKERERVFVEIVGTDYDGIYCAYYEDGSVYIENGSSLDTACDIAVLEVKNFLIMEL